MLFQGYGFTVSQLYDLLLEIRDQYSEVLMKKWVQVFNAIFDKDNYTPITSSNAGEYEAITAIYPFMDAELERVGRGRHQGRTLVDGRSLHKYILDFVKLQYLNFVMCH